MMQPNCGKSDCPNLAVWRADYFSKSWPKPVYRCTEHTGCHDFTHRWDGEKWVAIEGVKTP
jgi:hypothetical protein